jgi:aminoglycoside phosphotransferase (APT) family kinase protein
LTQEHTIEGDDAAAGAYVGRPDSSGRDPEVIRASLERWLAARLPEGSDPQVSGLEVPERNGMSSVTVLLDARWTEDGVREDRPLVARMAPEESAVPVFPDYDFETQFRVMQRVAALTGVPVPKVLWLETDPAAVGVPFFVMERAYGVVPPDVMPYDFGDNWLFDATPEQQQAVESSTVAVLAELHAIEDPEQHFAFLASDAPGDTPLRRHVAAQRTYYEWVCSDGLRSPLIEAAFDWLDEHWPDDEGPTVLSWGDSRIGNVMYRDFRPVAVLDWEMAGLATREVDLAWLIFLHRFFEEIAVSMGLPGMPHFLRRDEVAARYESMTGHTPRDLDFYTLYAALRHGIVMSQVQRRSIRFGDAEMPEDVDDLIMHRATLEAMLAGTYWDGVPTG